MTRAPRVHLIVDVTRVDPRGGRMPVELAPELLEILACPHCHAALAVDHERAELVCVASDCGLAYPVVDGIPVLLVDEARRPGQG